MREGRIKRITADPILNQILIQKLVNSGAQAETVEGIYGKNSMRRSMITCPLAIKVVKGWSADVVVLLIDDQCTDTAGKQESH